MVAELISNVAGIFSNWFKWKSSGVSQRLEAEGIVERDENAAAKRRADVNRACHTGDAAAVNRFLNECLAMACGLGFMAGCLSAKPAAPQYVAADREVTCTTNELGRAVMWHVPPLVMEELLNARLELDDLKKENKIKEIAK